MTDVGIFLIPSFSFSFGKVEHTNSGTLECAEHAKNFSLHSNVLPFLLTFEQGLIASFVVYCF